MNLPNKLTLLRVLLVPFFVASLLWGQGQNQMLRVVALIIFIVASLTDMLDGQIARRYHLVTNFGKFMDPLADKLLVCSALICFVELRQISAVVVIIIIAREFVISGFRLVAADAGVVIAASWWGKLKTVSQMIAVILMIIHLQPLIFITRAMVIVMTALTVISLIDYLAKNHGVLTSEPM
ncbi:CDP-diacylglycerol--glycerol-3-phosphate 3-phosphatidyltransferase [Lachnospiraceae bacterium oral taxon 096]|jgi:CDP-diacylglycerol--glycerol-3-phosphate 3-phosphatidyltransferase|nr:CDP-diacylglycerol--glycerol-3-phosphate 3-phosphatidyltransferase [Lachnospiraceae bacterium]MBS4936547.1 CDP-diacylglycerol--glycerol-3-phosphate 3-phosphatidyltransferase [Lachnospiraceae bacterium]PTL29328.1 CDP-diacylglycerol--glycerol-3-phosphate 3-phosphatidyltransferase [Lachnospiraceae bacterium oral taxon 096]QUI95310.1 CDP-diacylglycerol--glycerol-3-phosphate 3-phosphatidyltransferase [Lachnospiraceae bacterium oral taxon 096]RKW32417.1 MAG: CDP-diacylglycerol--glycerol-3-phosphat